MGFKIETPTLGDAREIAEMMVSASTSPRISLEFKDCKRKDWLEWNTKAVQGEVTACLKHPDEATALKSVDEESGKIAAYAVWGWSPKATELVFQGKLDLPLPAGANTALRNKFVTALQELEKSHQPQGIYFELLELVTSPVFQRRGIGSKLVNIGLKKADQEKRSCFLSGSPMGVPVYGKLGFQDVGRLEISLGEFGGEGSHIHVAMIRKPVGSVEGEASLE